VLYFLFRTPAVQTWAGKRITTYLSGEVNSEIRVGGVDIELFKKIILENVYVEDKHGDTLLFAQKLKLDISSFEYRKQKLVFKSIVIDNTVAKIIRYKNEKSYNYQFLVDAFSSDKKDTTNKETKPWDIRFDGFQLVDVDFTYRDQHDSSIVDGLNYWDLRLKNTNASIGNIYFKSDTIYANIQQLSAKEKSGFVLGNLSCVATISSSFTKLDNLKIKTEKSDISTDLLFTYSSYDDYNDFIEKVTMNASFDKTAINFKDIAYFSPELKGVENTILFSGSVKGKVDNLKGNDVVISFGNNSFYNGNFSFKGLPNIDETFMVVDVSKMSVNKSDIESLPIPPFSKGEKVKLPPNTAMLGQMNFKGNFTGFISDFVAYGTFNSALGRIDADLSMVSDTTVKDKVKYHGKIKSYDFDIGRYLSLEKYLGKVSIDASVEGTGLQRDNVNARLKGTVANIDFNNYSYHNLNVEGELAKRIFKGKLIADDDNIKLNFLGDVDFSGALPKLSFSSSIVNANLAALKLMKSDSISIISTFLDVNIIGDNIDNILGDINVSNLNYRDSKGIYSLKNLTMSINEVGNNRNIMMVSDFADLNINGKYSLLELPGSMLNVLTSYVPALAITEKNEKVLKPQNFTFSLQFKNTTALTKLFLPSVKISQGTTLSGEFNSESNKIVATGRSSLLTINEKEIKDWQLSLLQKDGELSLKTGGDYIKLTDSLKIFNPSFYATTNKEKNAIETEAMWAQNLESKHQSNLKLNTVFENQTRSITKILPSDIYISDSLWRMVTIDNQIILDTSSLKLSGITFQSDEQEVSFFGTISNDKSDKISVKLTKFNLATVNPFISSSGTRLKGTISGETSVIDFYDKFLLSSTLSCSRIFLNNELIGDGKINSKWDKEKEGVAVDGKFSKGIITNLDFKGNYYPLRKENSLDIGLDLEAIKLKMFESYLEGYCSNLSGQFSGGITINGTPEKPLLKGKLSVTAITTIDYLNTKYRLLGDINIDNNSFGVENLSITDSKDQSDERKYGFGTASLTGKVYHDNFKNFQLDFDMSANKFQCLNTSAYNNELFYGRANVSGIINFFGYVNNIVIDANLKTEKGTQMNIPLSSIEEVSENSFITFKKKQTDTIAMNKNSKVDLNGMKLNFDLELTPAAEIQLIFDSKIGDVIRGRGKGNIEMDISTLGDFSMYGNYEITEGDYLFTLKNIVNKKFDIERGGTIKWSGDPYEAEANITAIYKQTASIRPFFPEDSSGKRYPVYCRLKMTDKLMSPTITFDIDLPTLDDNTRQQIKSYLNTEQEMNKQVFSLLILKSFVTPSQLTSSGGSTDGVSGAGVANSSELLSNQLSNWLSQISKDFDVGVNYRPGDDLSNEELEVALSTQVFNDRVTIDGNLGVTNGVNAQQNASNIAGDVNVEYKITNDGKLRLRAFNKANDNSLLTSATGPYTQGVGIFYREEFSSLGELYERYLQKLKQPPKAKE